MTIAYACVLASAYLPYAFILWAKATGTFFKGDYNKNPRDYVEQLEGPRKRASWAHTNGFEAFPPFAAGVIIAHVTGVAQGTIDSLALAFIACRVLHGIVYIANLDKLRTLIWTGGAAATVMLFIAAGRVG